LNSPVVFVFVRGRAIGHLHSICCAGEHTRVISEASDATLAGRANFSR